MATTNTTTTIRSSTDGSSNTNNESASSSNWDAQVVVVGGGISGLVCARSICVHHPRVHVTLLEASARWGGRICPHSMWGQIGAEIVHGHGTGLTHLLDELRQTVWTDEPSEGFYQPFFTISHADGGPDEKATPDGKYGMYFVDDELLKFDDPKLEELKERHRLALVDHPIDDPNQSIHDAFATLSPSLYALAEASYGNTAGDGNLRNLSLHLLQQFERHWSETEFGGDSLPRGGMGRLVEALVDQLKTYPNLTMRLETPVQRVAPTSDNDEVIVTLETTHNSIDTSTLTVEAVAVTVPPTILPSLVELTPAKREALTHVHLVRVIKVFARFQTRLWPPELQSLVCANCPIPELWFEDDEEDGNTFKLTGYLTSVAAEALADRLVAAQLNGQEREFAVGEVVAEQLSRVFRHSVTTVQESLLGAYAHDWRENEPWIRGGYLCPRVGLTRAHLEDLASPCGRLFFAGEATHTLAACTVHAAVETGTRAAREVSDLLQRQ